LLCLPYFMGELSSRFIPERPATFDNPPPEIKL